MDHVAIMRKSWGLIPMILDGRKKIESRWSKNKITPFGKVVAGDVVYFKNSGENVTVRASASKVIQYEKLSKKKLKQILIKYGKNIGIEAKNLNNMLVWVKGKRYCTLIYLKNPKEITPFSISKNGFGTGAAWLTVKNISLLKTS